MKISEDSLYPYLLYSTPFIYKGVAVYPVLMKDILSFQIYSQAITVRKNSRFSDKNIIKMPYLNFLVYVSSNPEVGEHYEMSNLSNYYSYVLFLLQMVCRDNTIKFNKLTYEIFIDEMLVTPEIFDDLRRIIIIQNDIDFDIDEFLNYDTEKRLSKVQNDLNKNADKITMEDYIDSLCVVLHLTEKEVMNMTIRKFWRFMKRVNLHENYMIMKTGECSGMVSFKEPIKHWTYSFDKEDKYGSLKANENDIRNKIG